MILHTKLDTDRTRITPISAEIAEAVVSSENAVLETGYGLRFPPPFRLPPMMDDFMPAVVQKLKYEPEQVGWWGWLFADKDTRVVLGSVGVSGPPDDLGAVGIAFSVLVKPRPVVAEILTAFPALSSLVRDDSPVLSLRSTFPRFFATTGRGFAVESQAFRQSFASFDIGQVLSLAD